MIRAAVLFSLAAIAGFGEGFRVEAVANPSQQHSLQANWSRTKDGSPLLSWIEASADGSYALKYAVRHGGDWSEARTVAAHRHFFRHPAESPEVIVLGDGSWLAHWVEMPKEGADAEYLYVSASKDGLHWSMPVMAHKDRSPVQHGLASVVASGDHEASVLWLQALKGEDGPTSLMRTIVSSDGKVMKEESLDSDVCACCPTAVVQTSKGLLVAYRGHTSEDVRDIAVVRFENGRWSPSKILNPDKWVLNACPTNAAAVSAQGDHVAISWYTGAQDSPRVQIAFSSDSGSTFGKPVMVSTGRAFGYTSVALDEDGGALVSWLEEGGGSTRVLVRHVAANGTTGPVTQIAKGGRQSLGYPRVLRAGHESWIAWGDATAASKVQTARLSK
jgi:hypothetical protein